MLYSIIHTKACSYAHVTCDINDTCTSNVNMLIYMDCVYISMDCVFISVCIIMCTNRVQHICMYVCMYICNVCVQTRIYIYVRYISVCMCIPALESVCACRNVLQFKCL
jgi:hypothetical protein